MKRLAPRLAGFLLAAAAAHGVAAETPPIAEARDTPYPGTIALAVDATDLTHAIFRAHETIPVAGPGPLTLFYPKWLPGDHAPTGPLDKLAGLAVSANGKPLAWTRDPVDVYAFHLDVPADAAALDVDLQFVSPVSARDGRVMMTTRMLSLQWNDVMLYPAGYYARRIGVRASVTLPDGFIPETALPRAPGAGRTIAFEPVSLETLVDSPLLAGRNVKTVDLDPDGPVRVTLDMVGDDARDLAITPQQIVLHRALVRQAYRLFGARHFDHYDFLMSVSDHLGDIGLEHQQSSEDGVSATYFTNWDEGADDRDTLAHEFVHAWNGKFRRPADLWTPNFNLPMRDSLLWVYEGQTQYWGYVLAARAGLMTRQDALDAFALTAAVYGRRAGRTWRPLEDTTNDPLIAMREPLSWPSWQRSEDYYAEGQLLWLDVDTLIRQGSGGRRSLDDFARAFFGGANGLSPPSTYDFDDVVAALNQVRPYDWAGFLRERLDEVGARAPLDGLARGGYRLVYADQPTDYFKRMEAQLKYLDLTFSLGMIVGRDGGLLGVLWDGPAFKAGLTKGCQIVAVNGRALMDNELEDAIADAKGGGALIELLVRDQDEFRTVRIDYHGGPRYPRLERIPGTPDLLDDILTPRN